MVVVVVVVVVLRCVAADSKGETEEGILEKYKKRKLQPQRQQQQRQQLTAVAIAGMGPIVQKLFNFSGQLLHGTIKAHTIMKINTATLIKL